MAYKLNRKPPWVATVARARLRGELYYHPNPTRFPHEALCNDSPRVRFEEAEADHAGHENRTIHGLRVAIDVTELAGELTGNVGQARASTP